MAKISVNELYAKKQTTFVMQSAFPTFSLFSVCPTVFRKIVVVIRHVLDGHIQVFDSIGFQLLETRYL
jgi:hypothetical protein